ncbi:acetate--CoA ligase family protein [Mangrovibacterium marinum]|uniref:acetate--CoA ligase family protein n=1 Tax=Mangrovibacterium marinum TaxID=1639118 RepID=UPI002A18CA60|nr:acetate--CoA ligase family protein [Mangrovibacterium marinum]
MFNQALIRPQSIVVVGASNNPAKPGGHLLQNLLQYSFGGKLYVVNPKEDSVQGVAACRSVADLPSVELAILAIPAAACVQAVRVLAEEKGTKAFIVVSAGFAESGDMGQQLENELLKLVDQHQGCLIGPNCIGVISPAYAGVFTSPVPALDPRGIDFVSGSGATAVFCLEAGMKKGLRFASVFTVGNSAQIGVEEVLQHWDESFTAESPKVKLLYLEGIRDPQKLLKHARSLRLKGCRIAAIKAGTGESGSRAALSHTGAMASPDVAVDALFRKAGIIRCYGRDELTTVAGLLLLPAMAGNKLAVITHAGGPAVMLTDCLEKGGLQVPRFPDSAQKEGLKSQLYPGSSVENPIDFLATGTAQQLAAIIDCCEHDFPEVDAMVVIFGSPGLVPVNEVYQLLSVKMKSCRKPIYPVLPSVVNADEAIREFMDAGNLVFTDEVAFGHALLKVTNAPQPMPDDRQPSKNVQLQQIIASLPDGFLPPLEAQRLLEAAGIATLGQLQVDGEQQALDAAAQIGFPLAMKVVGPLHKSDVGGVLLNLRSAEQVAAGFRRLMAIAGTSAVLLSPMLNGLELYIGAKYEKGFGHLIFVGLGGVWLEIMKDVQVALAPVSRTEALQLISKLKALPLLNGYRGQRGVDIGQFADLLVQVSRLVEEAPLISELDLNPIVAEGKRFSPVDIRIALNRK